MKHPSMTLGDLRRICKQIADDIEMLGTVKDEPDIGQRLKADIKENLDKIVAYWSANR